MWVLGHRRREPDPVAFAQLHVVRRPAQLCASSSPCGPYRMRSAVQRVRVHIREAGRGGRRALAAVERLERRHRGGQHQAEREREQRRVQLVVVVAAQSIGALWPYSGAPPTTAAVCSVPLGPGAKPRACRSAKANARRSPSTPRTPRTPRAHTDRLRLRTGGSGSQRRSEQHTRARTASRSRGPVAPACVRPL